MRTLDFYVVIQYPTEANGFTTGVKRLFGIGKKINECNLWWCEFRRLKFGFMEIVLNFNPNYYV